MIYKAIQFQSVSPPHSEDGTGLWDLSGKRALVTMTMRGEFIDREVTNYQYLVQEAHKFGGELVVKASRTDEGTILYNTDLIRVDKD